MAFGAIAEIYFQAPYPSLVPKNRILKLFSIKNLISFSTSLEYVSCLPKL